MLLWGEASPGVRGSGRRGLQGVLSYFQFVRILGEIIIIFNYGWPFVALAIAVPFTVGNRPPFFTFGIFFAKVVGVYFIAALTSLETLIDMNEPITSGPRILCPVIGFLVIVFYHFDVLIETITKGTSPFGESEYHEKYDVLLSVIGVLL